MIPEDSADHWKLVDACLALLMPWVGEVYGTEDGHNFVVTRLETRGPAEYAPVVHYQSESGECFSAWGRSWHEHVWGPPPWNGPYLRFIKFYS
jgi:hypothetical protein